MNGKNLWVNVSSGHFPALVGANTGGSVLPGNILSDERLPKESSQQEKTLGNLGPRGLRASLVLV